MKPKRSHHTHEKARPARVEASKGSDMSHIREIAKDEREIAKEIEELAYFFWEERGCQGGSAEDDWIRAEAEVRNRRSVVT